MDNSQYAKSGKRKRDDEDQALSKKRKTKKAKSIDSREPKIKKSEASIRNERLANGALLLKFTVTRPDMNQRDIDDWRHVEKKGFFVTEQGCLIPADCHLFENKSKRVGYDCSLKFFKGQKRDPSSVGKTNLHGWDCEENVSHLCHRNSCSSFKHLELVERWRNLKRNYCGFLGVCDCGSNPKCIDTYHPPSFVRQDTFLKYSTPGLKKKLVDLFEVNQDSLKVKVEILQKDYYAVQDQKRKNRDERIKGSKKTAKETKKKQKRSIKP